MWIFTVTLDPGEIEALLAVQGMCAEPKDVSPSRYDAFIQAIVDGEVFRAQRSLELEKGRSRTLQEWARNSLGH